jgi:hypothetical protein
LNLPLLTAPNLAALPGLRHGFTTREGGVSEGPYASLNLGWATGDDDGAVEANYERLAAAFGTPRERLIGIRQDHGAEVMRIDGVRAPQDFTGRSADALVTSIPGLVLTVRVADCLPILLVDPESRGVAAVHAGWRGTLAGVLPSAVEALVREFRCAPSSLRMAVGPGIGACCFEVSTGIAALMEHDIGLREGESREVGRSVWLDLTRINSRQAVDAGLLPERIWTSGLCTKCDARFFSYRRDGKRSGRSVGAIGWSA